MANSLDLLNAGIKRATSERKLSEAIGQSSSALSVARHKGNLSPEQACAIAQYLGLEPTKWVAMAALEARKNQGPHAKALLKELSSTMYIM